MKQLKTFFLIVSITFTLSTTPTYAAGMPVIDWAAIVQFIKSHATQLTQLAKETSTSISSGTSAIQQTLSTINQTVFRPLQDAMLIASVVKGGKALDALVSGAATGIPLIPPDPERHGKMQGVNALKVNVNYLDKAEQNGGVYANSAIKSIVDTAKLKSDTEGRLASLSQSAIPTGIQEKLCEDSQLENIASNEVSNSENPTLEAIRDRKQELWDKLCVGDPTKDKMLAQALSDAGKATGVGTMEIFREKTRGDNSFTRNQKILDVVEEDRASKVAAAAADIQRGNGVISKTECVTKSTGLTEACAEKAITNLGYQLSESLVKKASNSLDLSPYGNGGLFFAEVFGSIKGILGSVQEMRGAINGISGSANAFTANLSAGKGDAGLQININEKKNTDGTTNTGTGNGTNSTTNTTTNTNTTTTTTTNKTYDQDLANSPERKSSITKPILDLLDQHGQTLNDIETSGADYLSAIAEYSGHLNGVGSCFINLISMYPAETLAPVYAPGHFDGITFPSISNDSRVSSAMEYYNGKKASTESLKSTITKQTSLVTQTRTLIRNTRNILTTSNSTEEIVAAYDTYTKTVENDKLPPVVSGTSMSSDIIGYRAQTESDIQDFTGTGEGDSSNGVLTVMKNACATIGNEEGTKRNTARQARAAALSASGN